MINYENLYNKIISFLENPAVDESCGNIYKLIDLLKDELHIVIQEYTDFDDELMGISSDGFTIYDGINFIICYNKLRKKRIKFTLAHELGHIILGHFFQTPSSILVPGENSDFEKEANIFSRCLNCPAPVLTALELLFGLEAVKEYLLSKGFSESFINNALYWKSIDCKKLETISSDTYSKTTELWIEELTEFTQISYKKVD